MKLNLYKVWGYRLIGEPKRADAFRLTEVLVRAIDPKWAAACAHDVFAEKDGKEPLDTVYVQRHTLAGKGVNVVQLTEPDDNMPGAITQRLQAEWRIDKSGQVIH